ncbi:hypothetical protein [Streptomyces sp. NPDC059442]|uniref:hypothetical protein n=1 Tax=unclassified Streptomyces TaxID=2593676 RepID=UPI0036898DC7
MGRSNAPSRPASTTFHSRRSTPSTPVAARMPADLHELLMSPDAARRMLAFFQPDGA